jgi:hypothetical protein
MPVVKDLLFTALLCKRFKLRIYEVTQYFLKWEYVFAALMRKRGLRVFKKRATSKVFGTKVKKAKCLELT